MAQVAELLGCIEATENDIVMALREGYSVALLVGGVKEQMYQIEGKRSLFLERNGFYHVAKKGRADIVPVYCAAELDLFESKKGWALETFQKAWFAIFGIPFTVCTLDTFKRWVSYLGAESTTVFPTVIGNPISWRLPIESMKKNYKDFFTVEFGD
jgi:hypothetical protein